MELWDAYDANCRKTGRTIVRGEPIKEGDYHLVVHIYIINSKNEFLIQKRSMKKEIWPGRWDVTGGSVVCGEDSITGAIREVEEELGISISPENFELIARLKKKNHIVDIWAAYSDINLDEVAMQEDEVDEVKYVTQEEMIDIIFGHEKADLKYKDIMDNFIKALK